jgi:hypothetical protein
MISVCVLGKRVHETKTNPQRLKLMQDVMKGVEAKGWNQFDAIVFPGAYFYLPKLIGHLTQRERSKAILATAIGKASADCSKRLHTIAPGAHLIVGADSTDPKNFEFGDQLCIAFSNGKVVGLARKIFPTEEDTNGWTMPYVPYLQDYDSELRVVTLPSGAKALLCNCYDMFGLSPGPNGLPRGSRSIRDLWRDGEYFVSEKPGFASHRTEAINRWIEFRKRHEFDVAITTIHDFRKPGTESYWSRHGISAASAALQGGLAIGAAHFTEVLPTANQATLAASGVDPAEASTGARRKSSSLLPVDHFEVCSGSLKALVRLFGAAQEN